ncbi:shikimate kinase [Arachnia propionica]|uniref:Shikimate kinase n=1 Tax=Arachnia propionica TaxID=1750 RepID=A0A3P1TDK7_9ACTN|nr:shikimate kinase [Arachnia propionica]RRD07195.1 shikimate kinase [Arachnia propionica]
MSIVLIGAPGAGKTSVGVELANRLGTAFVDVDTRIEQVVGKPVAEIFTDEGEEHFRTLEESASLELLGSGGVIALGGGAVVNPTIRQALAGHDVIWLEVSAPVAARRVGLNTARPLLLGNIRARLIEQLRERTPFYQELAGTRVDTDGRSIDDIAAELASTRMVT